MSTFMRGALFLVLSLIVGASFAGGPAASRARAATTLCLGGSKGCYSTLQSAFNAAHDR